jgi:Zn-finger nucleic acid-binding protein
LIKELPTYENLVKRKVNGINTDICPRCREFIEDWEHIWICEANDLTIEELIKKSICEYEVRTAAYRT